MPEEIEKKARTLSLMGRRKIFNSLLKKAIRAKGISITMLAERINAQPGTVQHWVYGIHVPPAQYGPLLSDALDTSVLEKWLDTLYTFECVVCKSIFRTEGFSGPRKFCGDDCRRIAAKVGSKAFGKKITREQELLLMHKRSVAAFCHQCALSPICPNAKCELRPVSPLKTAEETAATRPPRRHNKWSEERKVQFSQHMKQQWADPEVKAKKVKAIKDGVASLGEGVREHRSRKAKENWDKLSDEEKQRRAARTADALQRGREKYQRERAAAKG